MHHILNDLHRVFNITAFLIFSLKHFVMFLFSLGTKWWLILVINLANKEIKSTWTIKEVITRLTILNGKTCSDTRFISITFDTWRDVPLVLLTLEFFCYTFSQYITWLWKKLFFSHNPRLWRLWLGASRFCSEKGKKLLRNMPKSCSKVAQIWKSCSKIL